MKKILHHLRSGQTILAEVPVPRALSSEVLIRTKASLVSLGTERMLIDFGKAGLVGKARRQPEKVRQVLEKMKTDGIAATLEAVRAKLDQPIPLGYSNVGVVLEVGEWAAEAGIRQGDRVVSNGPHAEVVCVPKNLCAKVPENVDDVDAVFTVLGAVALQGIRLLQPTLGESVAVIGLGVIGQMCVQILRAHGCKVLGIDLDEKKCALARGFGADALQLTPGADPVAAGMDFSRGYGLDGVVIAASTPSSDPVHQAAQMCRQRGRIVLIGVTGLQLSRSDFYEKELTFQVSCSYGPGRHDPNYEQLGNDYPIGFVRWTEQRNFEAVLEMLADGRLRVQPLISHQVPFKEAPEAYERINEKDSLGIVLRYDDRNTTLPEEGEQRAVSSANVNRSIRLSGAATRQRPPRSGKPVIGVIGAGSFARQVLLPALSKTDAHLKTIVSAGGTSAAFLGKKFGFETATTDLNSVFNDPEIDAVVIATRHDTHADLVMQGLRAGKYVFVEKPLCVNEEDLVSIISTYDELRKAAAGGAATPWLLVGFNRRFSPHVKRMNQLLSSLSEPRTMIMTVNAGSIPRGHWTLDPTIGGGRIIGEGCHFIDLLRFLAGSGIQSIQVSPEARAERGTPGRESITFTLTFRNGSVGTVHYFTNGNRAFPKERLEVFCAGRIIQLDNFRRMHGFGWPGFRSMRLWRQDKGHRAELGTMVNAIKGGKPSPIGFDEIVEVTKAAFQIAKAARTGV